MTHELGQAQILPVRRLVALVLELSQLGADLFVRAGAGPDLADRLDEDLEGQQRGRDRQRLRGVVQAVG
jgi:hypothetical protein